MCAFIRAVNPLGDGNREEWRRIPGCPGYGVSNMGRVRSYRKNASGHQMFLVPTSGGYLKVLIRNSEGKRVTAFVHRLVAQCFLQKVEGKEWVNHKNCNKKYNCVRNLEWVNRLENADHARRMGRYASTTGENHWTHSQFWRRKIGERNGRAILTEEQARAIKYGLWHISVSEIAEKFGITKTAVCSIRNGKNWRHL